MSTFSYYIRVPPAPAPSLGDGHERGHVASPTLFTGSATDDVVDRMIDRVNSELGHGVRRMVMAWSRRALRAHDGVCGGLIS
ncbi:MAG: hypothetical protein QOH12_239 [Solirubrobacteraceae bacterium]|jgi:hypothetical protein|nr:hypothetical protein [Solirubrobacteraceae bacterium]